MNQVLKKDEDKEKKKKKNENSRDILFCNQKVKVYFSCSIILFYLFPFQKTKNNSYQVKRQ